VISTVKPELHSIADNVINCGNTRAVTPLPDEELTSLHFVVTKKIHDRKILTDTLKINIYQYVKSLTRYHRGLFWRIFNYFCKNMSELWYLCHRRHLKIILHSLWCDAPKVSLEYWSQVQSLDSVMDHPIPHNTLGMIYDH